MDRLSLLHRTGQLWEFNLWLSAVMAAGLALGARRWVLSGLSYVPDEELRSALEVVVWFGPVPFSFLTSIIALLPIRCPRCKTKWLWRASSTQDSRQWNTCLLSLTECPSCPYPEPPRD